MEDRGKTPYNCTYDQLTITERQLQACGYVSTPVARVGSTINKALFQPNILSCACMTDALQHCSEQQNINDLEEYQGDDRSYR